MADLGDTVPPAGLASDDPVSSIRNLGPAMDAACAKAGIHTAEQLRALGAHEAYRRLIETGTRPHFIGYYVLHMALQGRPWNDCTGPEKTALRGDFDRLKAQTTSAKPQQMSDIDAKLAEIGVLPPDYRPR